MIGNLLITNFLELSEIITIIIMHKNIKSLLVTEQFILIYYVVITVLDRQGKMFFSLLF